MLFDELETRPKARAGLLKELYTQYSNKDHFKEDVVHAITSHKAALERNGSWLLKWHVEKKKTLHKALWKIVLQNMTDLTHWEAKLHLCQILSEHIDVVGAQSAVTATFLLECAADPRPMLRAWAISAFYQLAKTDHTYKIQAEQLLEHARLDPAKSVRARMRRLL